MNFEFESMNLGGADFHHHNSFYVGLSPVHSEENIDRLIKVFEELDHVIDYG